ncbi:MAG: peptidase M64 [Bacteroidales bacterium]|nr:peptidase M64 [Bacteroidales bacterium]
MNKLILLVLGTGLGFLVHSQVTFNDFFQDKTLRIDYTHAGNVTDEDFFLLTMKEELYWGGSLINLVDTFNWGNNLVQVYDSAANRLIYSRGFSNLFWEWRLLPEAKIYSKGFYESLEIPYPRNTVRIDILSRDKQLNFKKVTSWYISPDDYRIAHDKPVYNFKVDTLLYSGNSHQKVDLVFLAEGYTQAEMEKFRKDVRRMIKKMFEFEPFKSHQTDFNFWAIESPSEESGTDNPRKNDWKNTLFNSHFNTFDSDRYLTTTDLRTIHDVAALAPHDQIYVLANTDKYGGGGIYNYFSLTSVDNDLSEWVFVHEFGHAFAGLADEYYYDEDEYANYYPKNVEPWEPNITSLTNFAGKWKSMLPDTVPVPTPDTKSYYNVVGAFEGGGYVSKGIYRPVHSCIMKELRGNDGFCPVCRRAITQRILFYTK